METTHLWLITFESLEMKQSYIPYLKVLLCGIIAFSCQWRGCIFTLCYIHLNFALLLHKIVLVMFLFVKFLFVTFLFITFLFVTFLLASTEFSAHILQNPFRENIYIFIDNFLQDEHNSWC